MALHLILRYAESADADDDWASLTGRYADLPEHKDDYNWNMLTEILFQDTDILALFSRRLDSIEDSDTDQTENSASATTGPKPGSNGSSIWNRRTLDDPCAAERDERPITVELAHHPQHLLSAHTQIAVFTCARNPHQVLSRWLPGRCSRSPPVSTTWQCPRTR